MEENNDESLNFVQQVLRSGVVGVLEDEMVKVRERVDSILSSAINNRDSSSSFLSKIEEALTCISDLEALQKTYLKATDAERIDVVTVNR